MPLGRTRTIGIPGERVTTVIYELAASDFELIKGRVMIERRAQIEVENAHGGNRTGAVGIIVATHWMEVAAQRER